MRKRGNAGTGRPQSSSKALLVLLVPLLLLGVMGCSLGNPETPATITPESEVFGANTKASNYHDIVVTLNPGSHKLRQITWAAEDEQRVFFEGRDYKREGDTITFPKESLKEIMPREGGNVRITFEMDGGDNPVLTLSLAPDEGGFELQWYIDSLIPEGAVNTGDADNRIFLTSDQSVAELITFYQEAIARMEMEQTEVDPSIKADWSYAGIHGDYKFGIYLTKGKSGSKIELTFHSTKQE